jgi:hypothetical protein
MDNIDHLKYERLATDASTEVVNISALDEDPTPTPGSIVRRAENNDYP